MKIRKLISAIMCFTLLAGSLISTYAEEKAAQSEHFELYRFSAGSDGISVEGRFFEKSKCQIELEMLKGENVVVSQSVTSKSDGSFSVTADTGADCTEYTMRLSADNGAYVEYELDMAKHDTLYELGRAAGYDISEVAYEYDAVYLCGTHSGAENGVVSLRVMDGERAISLAQTISDSDRGFELEFKTLPGTYTLHLMAEGAQQVSCEYTEVDFANIFVRDCGRGENVNYLVEALGEYVAELNELSAECNAVGIPTDYEDAYIAIIGEFITYINNEAGLGLYDRFGQYYYTLKPLYENTKQALQGYLNGTATPLEVSRFRTGGLEFDGKIQRATLETDGKKEEKPVFFVGYGHWDTAAEKIPLFEKLGFNIISTEIMMKNVIVQGVYEGWTDYVSKSSAAEFSLSENNSTDERYSLKISNNDEVPERNRYRSLSQKIKVKPGVTYEYGLRAMGSGIVSKYDEYSEHPVWFGVRGLDTKGRMPIDNSDGWRTYQYEYTTGAGEDTLDLTIMSAYGTDEVYIDDVYVREKGTNVNLVQNGDFENIPEPGTETERAVRSKGWYINYEELNKLEDVLQNAEEHNMLVDMCLCPSFMPEFILKSDPNSQRHKEYFLPFVMENETMKEAFMLWARLLGETLEKYDCVHSLCLLNEPEVHANGQCSMEGHSYDDGYYVPFWHAYLEDKYKDITKLNLCYGTSYDDFEDVTMPQGIEYTPVFYDYREFNDGVLTDYIEWLAGEVKKYFPDIAVHTKMMDYFTYGYTRMLQNGADFEKTAEFTDVNGCDGFSYYRNTSYNYTKTPLELKMGWYDFMTSVKDAPVWDTESHISNDYPIPEYDDLVPYYTGADVWNGAIHGRGAQIIWLWDLRRSSLPGSWSNYPNANAVMRPADVIQVSKTALDLNRLSDEVTALQSERPRVGILYSRASLGYNGTQHMDECAEAYRQIIFSGQKAGFVTDTRPEDMSKYELLVVPSAANVPEKTLLEVGRYIENGGELLILGQNSLRYDEHNKAHSTETVDKIYENADAVSKVTEKISEMELSDVLLVDADTGEETENIEWTYTKSGGRYFVNIMNYDMETEKRVRVVAEGKNVATATELISGEEADCGELLLKPYQPKLLSIYINTFDVVDENGNVLKENINKLENGRIKYNASADGALVYALYKDDVLVDVCVGEEAIEIPAVETGRYRLMAVVWDMQRIKPMTAKREICN